MIAHVSPSSHSFEESRTTLTYADRAKNITTKISRNSEDVTQHVSQYQSIIAELRKEIVRLKSKIDEQSSSLRVASRASGRSPHRAPSDLAASHSAPRHSASEQSMRRQRSDARRDSPGQSSKEFQETKQSLVQNFSEQMKLRNKLMEQNLVALDAATALSSKGAVLQGWDDKNNPHYQKSKYDGIGPANQPDSIKYELEARCR